MKKIIGVLLFSLVLGGCSLGSDQTSNADVNSINVTLSGTIQTAKSDGTYVFKKSDGTIGELHDGRVKLGSYVGKTVTVTGQYSGTTLYVDEVR